MGRGLVAALSLSILTSAISGTAAEGFVWWEGETPKESNFPKAGAIGLENAEQKYRLSEGAWLGVWDIKADAPLFAKYEIKVPKAGKYHFWTRKFWHYGAFRWRFDEQPWKDVNGGGTLVGSVSLGAPKYGVCADWLYLGEVGLAEGSRQFQIEATKGPFAIDCYILSEKPFVPHGKVKPGEKYGRTEDGWFAFEPGADAFEASALLDLRPLNHKESGEKGCLRTNGENLVWEKEPNVPVKFWGSCVGTELMKMDKGTVDYFSRRMAKLGMNMVRMHGGVNDGKDGTSQEYLAISDATVDRFNYMVAAFRRNGIYLMLNFHYDIRIDGGLAGFPGYKKGQKTPQFLFIHPQGQAVWKEWIRRLLSAKNPYTGLTNAEDPTVAIVQVTNEDSYFFWTFDPYKSHPEPVIQVLEKRFGDWLAKKYGSLDKAKDAWGPDKPPKGDDFASGRAGLYSAGRLGGSKSARDGRNEKRAWDQAQFLTEDERAVLASLQDYLKKDLGYKGLVNGLNWMYADARVLEPLDKYANTACDMMDRHGVSIGVKQLKSKFFWWKDGDKYADRAVLLDPEGTPIMDVQYEGKPHMFSEPKIYFPNRFRAEYFPMMAAYNLLQGTDAVAHFAGSAYWQETHEVCGMETAAIMGQSPAAALICRGRLVKEGPVVVREALKLKDLYELKGAAFAQAAGTETVSGESNKAEGGKLERLDPLSFFVGKVVRAIAEDPGQTTAVDMKPFIDREKKVIRSATGELTWDYGRGLMTIHAPCARGAAGFLGKAGAQTLGDSVIAGGNEYGSILAVSMDGEPLESSKKILVQAMSEDRNHGWKTKSVKVEYQKEGQIDMNEIVDAGGPPILVRNIAGSVAIKRPDAAQLKVTALDLNGYRRAELAGGKGAEIKIELLPDCLYYLIQK